VNDLLRWTDVRRLAREGSPDPPRRDERPEAEWREALTPDRYRVLRGKGTERPFSSEMCSRFEPGRYACAGCGTVLFDAEEKFESGTGWPSFTQPVRSDVVAYHEDRSFGMMRVEAVCAVCDGHLGHVFPDGPPPTELRYCINALALEKVKGETTETPPRPT
jgi:peptide-methionine (R)-S-oxide reductase